MRRFALIIVVACVAFTATMAPAAMITLNSSYVLQGHRTDQTIPIYVTGSDQVAAMDLYVQVGDGGVNNGGKDTQPIISGVDTLTGTIFTGGNAGTDNLGLIWHANASTSSGTVAANGKIATITFDTTNTPSGSYTLILKSVGTGLNPPNGFNTSLWDASTPTPQDVLPAGNINATTIIVQSPEPASLSLIALGSALLLPRRRRK